MPTRTSPMLAALLLLGLLGCGEVDREKQGQLAGRVVRDTTRLEAMVSNILDAGQLREGRLALSPEPLHLATVARLRAERAAELDAIAAVNIGGASFLGGRGTALNALIGALMIAIIRNAMNLANLESFFQLIVLGSVILVAVEVDVLRGWLERRLQLRQASLADG